MNDILNIASDEQIKKQTLLEYLQEIGIDINKRVYAGEENKNEKSRYQKND